MFGPCGKLGKELVHQENRRLSGMQDLVGFIGDQYAIMISTEPNSLETSFEPNILIITEQYSMGCISPLANQKQGHLLGLL